MPLIRIAVFIILIGLGSMLIENGMGGLLFIIIGSLLAIWWTLDIIKGRKNIIHYRGMHGIQWVYWGIYILSALLIIIGLIIY